MSVMERQLFDLYVASIGAEDERRVVERANRRKR